MITLRRARDRHHEQHHNQDIWSTFNPQDRADPLFGGFAGIECLTESLLPPGGVSVALPRQEAELVTYIFEGALAQDDSTGRSGVVYAGEFQRLIIGRSSRPKEINPSGSGWTRIFRITLRPSEVGLERAQEQKRFATAERHNVLCVVASPDGRRDSLRIRRDALILSSMLDPGHHIAHELLTGRSAWLHIISGNAILQDNILSQGDGAGLTHERSVSLTAQDRTEILLIDSGPEPG